MEFPLLNLLKTIRSELGPVLHELGVRPKFETKDWGVRVKFEAPDGSFSPVKLEITHSAIAGKGWSGSTMVESGFQPVRIGQSGWLGHRLDAGKDYTNLAESKDEAFDQIRTALKFKQVVQIGKQKPYYISNLSFVDVYQEIEEVLGGDYRFMCTRDENGVESFSFGDSKERQWRIAFQDGMADVYVDDELLKSLPQFDHHKIGRFVKKRVTELELAAVRTARI